MSTNKQITRKNSKELVQLLNSYLFIRTLVNDDVRAIRKAISKADPDLIKNVTNITLSRIKRYEALTSIQATPFGE